MGITLPETIQNDAQVWQAFRYHSRTFSMAARLLPQSVRMPIATLYLFCRHIDTIADQRILDVGAEVALNELSTLKAHLDATLADHPPAMFMWQRLQEVHQTFHLNPAPLYELIDGATWDLADRPIQTHDDLLAYSNLVGGSIGAMMLPFLLEDVGNAALAEEAARALGIAMQITNILRDVGEDNRVLGRVYLPQNLLSDYEITLEHIPTTPPPAYVALLETLMMAAEELYDEGLAGIGILPWRMRTGIRAAARMYREIMNEVRANGYDNLSRRAFVPGWRKSTLVLRDTYYLRKAKVTSPQAQVTA